MTPDAGKDQRSLSTLLAELVQDAVTLARQEIHLAKVEASEKISKVGSALAALFVGGMVVFAGFLVLLAAAVLGISEYFKPDVPLWLSALLVGAVVVIVGLIALRHSANELQEHDFIPKRILGSLDRDKNLLKEKLQ